MLVFQSQTMTFSILGLRGDTLSTNWSKYALLKGSHDPSKEGGPVPQPVELKPSVLQVIKRFLRNQKDVGMAVVKKSTHTSMESITASILP